MAVKKISELNVMVAPASDDLLAIVDTSEIDTKKITYANLTKEVKDSVDLVEADIITLDTRLDTAEADIVGLDSRLDNGWNLLTGTFTYASADTPTFVMNTPVDLTGVIGLGMRIKLTQTTVKYFIVTAITSTTITLYGGTDYTLVNETISNVSYSMVKTPFGFPTSPEKWSVIVTDNNNRTQSSPVASTWYNLNSTIITLPIGSWNMGFSSYLQGYRATAGNVLHLAALSTSLTAISNPKLSAQVFSNPVIDFGCDVYKEDLVIATVKTPYYFISSTIIAGQGNISRNRLYITATCAYL